MKEMRDKYGDNIDEVIVQKKYKDAKALLDDDRLKLRKLAGGGTVGSVMSWWTPFGYNHLKRFEGHIKSLKYYGLKRKHW